MTGIGDTVREGFADTPTVKVATGTYVSAAGSQVVVSMGDSTATMPLHSAAWPMPGERVVCANLDGRWLCFGPESPRQQWGIVHATGTGTATVEYPPGSGVTASMLVPRGDSPAPGDFALLDWANGGVIVRLYGAEPEPVVVDPPPTPASPQQTRLFRAVDAGTADGTGRWIRSELYARSSPQGAAAWFYGTSIRDAVGSRTVLGGRIRIELLSPDYPGDVLLGYHTLTSKSGVPDINAASVRDLDDGWQPLPLAIARALAADGRGVSFRTNSGGASSYKSLAQDPLSGQVEITYR